MSSGNYIRCGRKKSSRKYAEIDCMFTFNTRHNLLHLLNEAVKLTMVLHQSSSLRSECEEESDLEVQQVSIFLDHMPLYSYMINADQVVLLN